MYKRNCLSHGCFDKIPEDFIFEVDNKLYKEFRNNINSFIQTTVPINSLVLEIGPKDFKATPMIVNDSNIVETVDIVPNKSTTYVCDLTSDEVSIPQNRFDVIYCLEVIEHCSNPAKLLTTISSLLKPDGKIYISFPFQFRLHGPIPDNWRISEYGFKQLCSDTGLIIEKLEALIEPSRPAFPLHYTAICSKKDNVKQITTFLPVSIGEAVDKLTILDIKITKIANEIKKQECKKEYDALYSHLKPQVEKYMFWYNCLRYINLQIWEDQDIFRTNPSFDNRLAQKVLDMNDMRFRVKNRINSLCNSSLKEQKGYADKVGIFVGHMGMGDIINLNGAIRYASVQVDHLFVVCRKMFIDNLRSMIGDDPYIEIIPCENHVNDVFEIKNRKEINGRKITNWFISGNWLNWKRTYEDLPLPFYKDLQFPLEIRKSFFYYDRPANELSVPEVPYIFAHVTASSGSKINIENTKNLLIIDPNTNHYPEGHQFHNLAKQYVDKPIFTYGRVIENADEIHVTDSAFYCLACYLTLKASVKKCYNREDGSINEKYSFL